MLRCFVPSLSWQTIFFLWLRRTASEKRRFSHLERVSPRVRVVVTASVDLIVAKTRSGRTNCDVETKRQ